MQKRIQNLQEQIEKAKEQFIIVEGKKDKASLEKLGFKHIFILNETGKSLHEKIEQIENKANKQKVCILTDFDKRGKKMYLFLKTELIKKSVKLDSSLRVAFLKSGLSHIEGSFNFLKNLNN